MVEYKHFSVSYQNFHLGLLGLDPAGLTFHDVPKQQRLDKSDADYVDVIHTNGCYTFWRPWTVSLDTSYLDCSCIMMLMELLG